MSRTKVQLKLQWNGAKVAQAVKVATRNAMDETMVACVSTARSLVRVDTGALRSDISFKSAVIRGFMVEASFGAPTVPYAIFQEIGTVKMTAQPFLRPAADTEYPKLADRVARRLKGGGR